MKIITTLILFFLINISSVHAVSIYLDPQTKIDSNLSPNKTFYLNVGVNAKDMCSYYFKLSWDEDILQYINATTHPETLWSSYTSPEAEAISGQYSLAYSVLGQKVPCFTGTASLVTLRFKINGTGQTKIDFSAASMINSKEESITFTVMNGSFDNKETSKVSTIGRGDSGRNFLLDITNIIPIAVTISVIVILLIFVSFKFFAKKK